MQKFSICKGFFLPFKEDYIINDWCSVLPVDIWCNLNWCHLSRSWHQLSVQPTCNYSFFFLKLSHGSDKWGKIWFVSTGENHGKPGLVCKNSSSGFPNTCWCMALTLHRIYSKYWYWDTLTPYHTCPIICKSVFHYLLMCLKYCWTSGKQCRPRSDAAVLWHLTWVYTVCSGLSVPILRVIMVYWNILTPYYNCPKISRSILHLACWCVWKLLPHQI